MTVTYNVFRAAIRAGVRTIVTASSETVLGLPFDVPPPYIPVDEDCTRPESNYSLSKHLEEQLAIQLVRWHPDLSIQALRFSNVMDPADYAEFPSYDSDPLLRKWNLWGYIDARDGAQAVLKAIQRGQREPGFERYIIAAADTVMTRPNAELVGEVFPGVELRGDLGVNTTLLSIEKARRLLGFEPEYSWRSSTGRGGCAGSGNRHRRCALRQECKRRRGFAVRPPVGASVNQRVDYELAEAISCVTAAAAFRMRSATTFGWDT